MNAEAFVDHLTSLPASNSPRRTAREVLEWIDVRLASAGADAATTIFTKPWEDAGKDAGLTNNQTPEVAEVFYFMRRASERIEGLSPQAIVSILSCTLPLRAHPERAVFVVAAERQLLALGEDRVEDIMRGLR